MTCTDTLQGINTNVKLVSSMVDKSDITLNLNRLGLSKNEVTLYLTLIGVEADTVLELSKKTSISRSTVYNTVKSLVAKGFAEWIVEQHRKKVRVVRPSQLDFIVNEKKNEFLVAKSSIGELQTMISDQASRSAQTQVRYYQGKAGMKQMLWNSLKAKKVIGYSEFGRIDIVGQKFYDDYVTEFRKRKITDAAITNEDGRDYIKKYVIPKTGNHQLGITGIRYIKKSIYHVSGDHSIYNNVYAMSYWNHGEIVGVEIENEELVKLHTSIFNILWGIAKPIKGLI